MVYTMVYAESSSSTPTSIFSLSLTLARSLALQEAYCKRQPTNNPRLCNYRPLKPVAAAKAHTRARTRTYVQTHARSRDSDGCLGRPSNAHMRAKARADCRDRGARAVLGLDRGARAGLGAYKRVHASAGHSKARGIHARTYKRGLPGQRSWAAARAALGVFADHPARGPRLGQLAGRQSSPRPRACLPRPPRRFDRPASTGPLQPARFNRSASSSPLSLREARLRSVRCDGHVTRRCLLERWGGGLQRGARMCVRARCICVCTPGEGGGGADCEGGADGRGADGCDQGAAAAVGALRAPHTATDPRYQHS
jgi:hypothetical protein